MAGLSDNPATMVEAHQQIQAVVAISANGMIGLGSGLPWDMPEEFDYFRRMVQGAALVVGRATYDGIAVEPEDLFVVTRQTDLDLRPGWYRVSSVEEGLRRALATGKPVFVIGGAAVYAASWRYCSRFHITRIGASFAGDVRFPDEIPVESWRLDEETAADLPDRLTGKRIHCRFLHYTLPDPQPLPAA